jgi:hypothetical protein
MLPRNHSKTGLVVKKPLVRLGLKKTLLLQIGLFVLFLNPAFTQEEKTQAPSEKWNVGLEGIMAFSAGKNMFAFNVGGPSLLLSLHKTLNVGVCALPTLFLYENKVGLGLGFSPRIDYKNFMIVCPIYKIGDQWVTTLGLGYKFKRNPT